MNYQPSNNVYNYEKTYENNYYQDEGYENNKMSSEECEFEKVTPYHPQNVESNLSQLLFQNINYDNINFCNHAQR